MRVKQTGITWLVIFTAIILGLWLVGPGLGHIFKSSPPALGISELLITVVWVGAVIGVVRNLARLDLNFWQNLAGLAISAALLLGLGIAGLMQPLGGVVLVYASSFLGCLLGVLIREPNIMLPVALITPLIDYWTVNFGPVRQVLVGAPEKLAHVSAAIPSTVHLQPIAFIGAGDFLFMALFLSVAQRLKMSPDRTAWWFFWLVSIAMLMVILVDGIGGVPGMVVISLGFIAANLQHFRLSRSEVVITCCLAAIACIAVVAVQMM